MDYNFLKQKYDLSNGDISRLKKLIQKDEAISGTEVGDEGIEYYLAKIGAIPLGDLKRNEGSHALDVMKATEGVGAQIRDLLGNEEKGNKMIRAAKEGQRALIHGSGGESKE